MNIAANNSTEATTTALDLVTPDDATWILTSSFVIFTMQTGKLKTVHSIIYILILLLLIHILILLLKLKRVKINQILNLYCIYSDINGKKS